MATVKNININSFCDTVSRELSEMKEGIHIILEEARTAYGAESQQFRTYDTHLRELSDMIDWKLQLLMKACPYEWREAGSDIERDVQVEGLVRMPDVDFSGGYVGG